MDFCLRVSQPPWLRGDDEPITDLFTLRQGQWGCVEYNRRLRYQNGTRYYECMVFNIGLVSTLPPADVFVDAQPVRRYASIARLW